jgi:hypothetical protein
LLDGEWKQALSGENDDASKASATISIEDRVSTSLATMLRIRRTQLQFRDKREFLEYYKRQH